MNFFTIRQRNKGLRIQALCLVTLLLAGCGGHGSSSGSPTSVIPQTAVNNTKGVTRALKSVDGSGHFTPSQNIGYAMFQNSQSPTGVSGKTLVTSQGNQLRGAYISLDTCSRKDGGITPYPSSADVMANCMPTDEEIADLPLYGLNTIHVYAEDPAEQNIGNSVGAMATYLDHIIDIASQNNLYVIITIGNGSHPETFDGTFNNAFWSFYANRYSQASNVIFEIMNEPRFTGQTAATSQAYPPDVITMEASCYNIIRGYTTQTPVLFFTYASMLSALNVEKDITNLVAAEPNQGYGIWHNAGIAFHGYYDPTARHQTIATLQSNYAMVDTEFHPLGQPTTDPAETAYSINNSVSWVVFLFVRSQSGIRNPANYDSMLRSAQVSWAVPAELNLAFPWAVQDFQFYQTLVPIEQYVYNPPGAGSALDWTFLGNSGITALSSAFDWLNPPPPAGQTHVAFLQGTGSMSQTFTNLVPGQHYTMTFWQAARVGYSGGNLVSVSIDGGQTMSFQSTSSNWSPIAYGFTTPPGGSHVITFAGNDQGIDNTTFIGSVWIWPW